MSDADWHGAQDSADRRKRDPWRDDMTEAVKRIEGKLEENIGKLEENTGITSALSKKLDNHILNTSPVIDAYGKVQAGWRVVGWTQRAINWLLSKWQPLLILSVGWSIISHGGSWSDVWEKIVKIFK